MCKEMKTKKELQLEIEKLQNQIKELENQEYQSFKLGKKEIRIYKWENKKFKDFPMPKGFDLCEYFDFVKLINEEKIKLEEYPTYYYTKNQFKRNIKNDLKLSRLGAVGGYLYSGGDYLAGSDVDGRVVISKIRGAK